MRKNLRTRSSNTIGQMRRTDAIGQGTTDQPIRTAAQAPSLTAAPIMCGGMLLVVTAQVLMYSDPNLDLVEFAIACGLPADMTGTSGERGRIPHSGHSEGHFWSGHPAWNVRVRV